VAILPKMTKKTEMKKILLILILLNLSCNRDKFYEEYYSNGNLALKITLDNKGVKNGPFEEYYESGELRATGQYINGQVEDSVFGYYQNGEIREKGFFKNGHRQNWQEIYKGTNKLLRREKYYELKDSAYTEHLEYCSDRAWEGNDFHFTVTISNDTLIQQGIEKIEAAGVNRINIEKYTRVK